MVVQLLEAGGEGGQPRRDVVWLLWLPCEVVDEGLADNGC
jgi:hypothetical protein